MNSPLCSEKLSQLAACPEMQPPISNLHFNGIIENPYRKAQRKKMGTVKCYLCVILKICWDIFVGGKSELVQRGSLFTFHNSGTNKAVSDEADFWYYDNESERGSGDCAVYVHQHLRPRDENLPRPIFPLRL